MSAEATEDPTTEAQVRLHRLLIESGIEQVEAGAVDLNTSLVGAKDLPFEDLLALLNRAQIAADAIATCVAGLQTAAWRAKGDAYGDLEIEGLPPVSIRRTAARPHWDDRAVVGELLDRHLNLGDGDMPAPWTVVDWILDAAAVGYWRKTILRGLGIDPDDYLDTVPGNPRIEFQRTGDNPLLAGGSVGD